MTAPGSAARCAFPNRRKLHFDTIDDMLAEVDRLIAAESAGTLVQTGNWTLGQMLGHLAAWINYAYDGYPSQMRVPWFVRIIARLMKRSFIRKPIKPGLRIPQVAAGTFGVDKMSTEEGARRLREAASRLKNREPARHRSPAIGHLTDEERIALNLRHAELHLSFLMPGD